jgi:hypothetical protein
MTVKSQMEPAESSFDLLQKRLNDVTIPNTLAHPLCTRANSHIRKSIYVQML